MARLPSERGNLGAGGDRPLRVAILIRSLWPGGFARIAIEESAALNASEPDRATLIGFATRENGYRFDDLIRSRGVRVRLVQFRPTFRRVLRRLLLPLVPTIRDEESSVPLVEIVWWALFNREPYDILLCEDQFVGIAGVVRSVLRSQPYALLVAEPISDVEGVRALRVGRNRALARALSRILYRAESRILRSARELLFVSTRTERLVRERFDLRVPPRTAVLHPGCEVDTSPPRAPANPPFLLCASKWDLGRRPETAIAIARLTGIRCVLAGSWAARSEETRFRSKILETIPASGDPPAVVVTGPIPQGELDDLFRTAYAYVHWTPEGFAMGVVEALGHGVPVICTSEAGASDLLVDGVNGVIVRGTEPEAFVPAIRRLVDEPDLRESLARGARASAVGLAWPNHAGRLLHRLRAAVGA
ncbi:MAG TPA: glycosyltransferase family 4 protein [Thermoplasmata archaeon]|nr:glycosyltransferase family 4 protein [Thermoplasmata archaeon]